MRLNNGTIRHRRRSMDLLGHAHELTFCTYRGYKLLSKDRTRQWFIDALGNARAKHDLQILSYVIMPEHVHLIVLPDREQYQISETLRSIKQPVGRRAMSFLEKTNLAWLERLTVRRPGGKIERHFWQVGGGFDRNMVSKRALKAAIDYIHANPVRRGLCQEPSDWKWSSAGWWEGRRDVPIAMDATPSLLF